MNTIMHRSDLDYAIQRLYNSKFAGTKNGERAYATMRDFERFANHHLGTLTLEAIVVEYCSEMNRRGYSGGTWNRYRSILNPMLEELGTDEKIPKRREGPGRSVVLTAQQVEDITYVLRNHVNYTSGALTVFLANTGLRLGEALALTWSDIIKNTNQVLVRDSKSGRSRRVPLNGKALDALDELRTIYKDQPKRGPFTCISARSYQRAFGRACEDLEIADAVPHTLRHTFATNLVANGTSLPVVQRLLGHSSITVTMRYAHANDEQSREAVDSLAA